MKSIASNFYFNYFFDKQHSRGSYTLTKFDLEIQF